MNYTDSIKLIQGFIWGPPLIILLMGAGILLTFRLKVLQFRKLGKALIYMCKNEEGGAGEVTSFGALCTALAATIGTGNIVGVATAVTAGGPGAIFWMIVAAFFGMATKYAEGLLAVKYRDHDPKTGHSLGGPFLYIEKGIGQKWKWLAKLFALFGFVCAIMGTGTVTQISGITMAAKTFFDPKNENIAFTFGNNVYSWATVISAIVVTLCVALVLIGGIQSIAKVTTFVVPFMAIMYVGICLMILVNNISKIPEAFKLIFEGAFGLKPITGGAIGTFILAIQNGVARGIFSNEAGLGSAPIAAAAAQTKEPVRQGLVTMTGTFVDTIVICTMTGLTLMVTGAYSQDLRGVDMTIYAFGKGMSWSSEIGALLLLMCLSMFAFTTILGWNYYGERCLEYFVNGNNRIRLCYRWLYVIAVFIGPFLTLEAIWYTADVFNGLMVFPNLIGIVALNGVVVSETNDYFKRLSSGEIREF